MTHASSHIPKTYLVKVSGRPSEDALRKLRSGIVIAGNARSGAGRSRRPETRRTAPARIVLARDAPNPWFEVTLIEGRNRQIHRMFERAGHFVEKIKRIRLGSLSLDVDPGRFRPLSRSEVRRLTQQAQSAAEGNSQRGPHADD